MRCPTCDSEIVDDAAYCPWCGEAVPGAPSYEEYEYEAFISYRHVPRDIAVAKRIQRAIESFVVPRGMRQAVGKKRLGRVFRDQDELPTSASLSEQIEHALKRSPYLIAVSSPDARQSMWVRREVELFCSYHGRERVLVALTQGEPPESFPELLLSRLERLPDGTMVEEPCEPLAADMRDPRHDKLERLRLISALLGCGLDEIRQRQHARRARIVTAGALAVATVSLGFGAFSAYQQAQIERSYRQIQANESRLLASESTGLLAAGDRVGALRAALDALPTEADASRPFVPEAQVALEKALEVYPQASQWASLYMHTERDNIADLCVLADAGVYAVMGESFDISVYDLRSGARLVSTTVDEALAQLGASAPETVAEDVLAEIREDGYWRMVTCGSRLLLRGTYGSLLCLDPLTGDVVWGSRTPTPEDATLRDNRTLAITERGGGIALLQELALSNGPASLIYSRRLVLIDAQTGEPIDVFDLDLGEESATVFRDSAVAFDSGGVRVAVAAAGEAHVVDVATGNTQVFETGLEGTKDLVFVGDTLLLIGNATLYEGRAVAFSLAPVQDAPAADTPAVNAPAAEASASEAPVAGSPLWSREFQLHDIPVGDAGTHAYEESTVGLWGVGQDASGLGFVLISADNRLMLVNATTGEERCSLNIDGNVACARLFPDASGVFYCLSDGTMWSTSISESGPGTKFVRLRTSRMGTGDFVSLGDAALLVAVADENPSNSMVFSLWETGAIEGFRESSVSSGRSNTPSLFHGVRGYRRNCDNTLLAVPVLDESDERVAVSVVDTSTFSEVRRIDVVPGENAGYGFSTTDPSLLYLLGESLETVDVRTGEVLAAADLDGATGALSCAGGSFVVVPYQVHGSAGDESGCRVLDGRSLREIACVSVESYRGGGDTPGVTCAWCDGKTLILGGNVRFVGAPTCLTDWSQATCLVFDLETGDALQDDALQADVTGEGAADVPQSNLLGGFATRAIWGSGCFVANQGGTEVLVCDDAGNLRCHDVSDGACRWTATGLAGTTRYAEYTADDQGILVQTDASLYLLDAKSGEVVASAADTLGRIEEGFLTSDGKRLVAFGNVDGVSYGDIPFLAVVSLDQEAFGVTSEIYCGVELAEGSSTLLAYDLNGEDVCTLPYYTSDELRERGLGILASWEAGEGVVYLRSQSQD